jgi:hypothetical protein
MIPNERRWNDFFSKEKFLHLCERLGDDGAKGSSRSDPNKATSRRSVSPLILCGRGFDKD